MRPNRLCFTLKLLRTTTNLGRCLSRVFGKAYDEIWRAISIKKIEVERLFRYLIPGIYFQFKGRKFRFNVRVITSEVKLVKAGLLQRLLLSSLFFNIFNKDLATKINHKMITNLLMVKQKVSKEIEGHQPEEKKRHGHLQIVD